MKYWSAVQLLFATAFVQPSVFLHFRSWKVSLVEYLIIKGPRNTFDWQICDLPFLSSCSPAVSAFWIMSKCQFRLFSEGRQIGSHFSLTKLTGFWIYPKEVHFYFELDVYIWYEDLHGVVSASTGMFCDVNTQTILRGILKHMLLHHICSINMDDNSEGMHFHLSIMHCATTRCFARYVLL